MAKIKDYQSLLNYLDRIEPANGRPIAWAHERLVAMASEITKALGGPIKDAAPHGFEIVWKNRPKPGGYRGQTLEFTVRLLSPLGQLSGNGKLITVTVPH